MPRPTRRAEAHATGHAHKCRGRSSHWCPRQSRRIGQSRVPRQGLALVPEAMLSPCRASQVPRQILAL
eukprot:4944313-Alexandrium_andersonii.AAC.1